MAIVLLLVGAVSASGASDLQQVQENVRAVLIGPQPATAPGMPVLPSTVEEDLRTMQADGSWADQVYTDTDRVHWKALAHLPRLERITRAYCRAGRGQPVLLQRILTSLRFWLSADPHNENWWHNEIGVPRYVGAILVMLGDDAPDDLRRQGESVMRRAKWDRQTGANLLDETWIQVMRGCVERDPAVVEQAFTRTWAELRVVGRGEEGVQADGSFHQHGPLLYNQGYGTVVLECAIRFLRASAGTPYAPPKSAMDSLYSFMLDGDAWMTWRSSWDFSACGRGIVRPTGTAAKGLWPLLSKVGAFPADRADDLRRLTAGDAGPVGNRMFWCSDYMVQRRPNYFASVRMYSKRTANTDGLTNGENRRSHHIADGATCLMVTGTEYAEIYPAWDWNRIPGTTVEQETAFPTNRIRRLGRTDFVGGVSDGSIGCAAMDLSYDRLNARKAWFLFDHAIVCLGASITCDTDHPVATTLNQCLLHGPVYTDRSEQPSEGGAMRASGLHWLWHDGIGYVLPDPATAIDVHVGPQTGAWGDIGTGPATTVSCDVFNLAIDHGSRPTAASYAYVVLPAVDRVTTAAAAVKPDVQIVSNTSALQAVWSRAGNALQAVFREAGEVKVGDLSVRVDQPCMLICQRAESGGTVTIAEPTGRPATVRVRIVLGRRDTSLRIALPQGERAGKSVQSAWAITSN